MSKYLDSSTRQEWLSDHYSHDSNLRNAAYAGMLFAIKKCDKQLVDICEMRDRAVALIEEGDLEEGFQLLSQLGEDA